MASAARGKGQSKDQSKDATNTTPTSNQSIFKGVNEAKIENKISSAQTGLSDRIDKAKGYMEKESNRRKQQEEQYKEWLDSDQGKAQTEYSQLEIAKVMVPIIIAIVAFQLFTGANDA